MLVAAHATAAPADTRVVFPPSVSQGTLVLGKVPPGSQVRHAGRELRPTPYGTVVFGVGRDERGPLAVDVLRADGARETVRIAVTPRAWDIDRVSGVPKTVHPPPEIAARIAREQARVAAARERDDDRADFARPFAWPLTGRVSGRFGNQRIYNGHPGSPHSGMDIAAPSGAPVKAPAAGIVSFADPDLYLTGGTVLLDHGHGVSSNFLHLSRIDVRAGQRLEQGETIGAVGATGRASGPHLHWGMNWFGVRVDPLLVLEPRGDAAPAPHTIHLHGPTVVGYASGGDERAAALVRDAVEGVRRCLQTGGIDARAEIVEGGGMRLREAGQDDVDLVLPREAPANAGVYLFWPGKPGRAVPAVHGVNELAETAPRAAAEFFDAPTCAR